MLVLFRFVYINFTLIYFPPIALERHVRNRKCIQPNARLIQCPHFRAMRYGANTSDVGIDSATEGADSAPVSGQGTPSEEKVGQVEMGKRNTSAAGAAILSQFQSFFDGETLSGTHATAVTTKVTQGAKTFGSFLYSAANKAGSKIKESVKSNVSWFFCLYVANRRFLICGLCWIVQPILGEFNKEQDAFIRGQAGSEAAVAPWVGHANEEQVKEEILGLSAVSLD